MTEDDLLRAVLDMARLFGLRTAHFRPAQSKAGNWITAVAGDGKGYPDLTIVGPGGLMFRELKSSRGAPTPEQKDWILRLRSAGADAAIWRPADLFAGLIERELRALRSANPSATPSRKIQRDVSPIPQV
jgi:hypothetical protein